MLNKPMQRSQVVFWTIGALVLMLLSTPARADHVVYVDDDAPLGGDGSTWNSAYRFLQDALIEASNPASSVLEIRIAQGTYRPDEFEGNPEGTGNRESRFILVEGVLISGGYAGLGVVDQDARDIEKFETILSGDLNGDDLPGFENRLDNSNHVIRSFGGQAPFALDGLTIQGGYADGLGGLSDGGGLLLESSIISLHRCTIRSNFSAEDGGGLHALSCVLTVEDCHFEDNLSAGIFSFKSGGGAMSLVSCQADIQTSCFQGNRAEFNGGAVHLHRSLNSNPIVFRDSVFSNNSAGYNGGGVAGFHFDEMEISGCTFESNSTDRFSGGALLLGPSNSIRLESNTFFENSANDNGGAASINFTSDFSIHDCKFFANQAMVGRGGGVRSLGSPGVVTQCLLAANRARFGGAIHIASADVEIVNSTITANVSVFGGGALYGITGSLGIEFIAIVSNCLLWKNGLVPINMNDQYGASIRYSLIEDGWVGSNNIDADPLFIDPDGPDNDPLTFEDNDYRLQAASPAIDAGHNWGVPIDVADADSDGNTRELFPFDLGGDPRIAAADKGIDIGCGIPAIVDMGAYEYQGIGAEIIFADTNGDGVVDVEDLLTVLGAWGLGDGVGCVADLNLDGTVAVEDLLVLLGNWG